MTENIFPENKTEELQEQPVAVDSQLPNEESHVEENFKEEIAQTVPQVEQPVEETVSAVAEEAVSGEEEEFNVEPGVTETGEQFPQGEPPHFPPYGAPPHPPQGHPQGYPQGRPPHPPQGYPQGRPPHPPQGHPHRTPPPPYGYPQNGQAQQPYGNQGYQYPPVGYGYEYQGQYQGQYQQPPQMPYQPQQPQQPNQFNNQYYYDECVPNPYQNQGVYPAPPKKGLSTGAKVFIAILSAVTLITLTIFVVLAISSVSVTPTQSNAQGYEDFLEEYAEEYGGSLDDYFSDYGDGDSDSDSYSDSDIYSESSGDIVQPDIEVTPYEEGITINDKPDTEEMTAQEVYEKVIESVVSVDVIIPYGDYYTYESSGTGFFLTEDGYILTNSHVIGDTKLSGVTVITNDGAELPAVIVAFDKTTDIAILKVDGTGYTPAELGDSDDLEIGEWVMAIGSPGGDSFSGSLTRGVVSGLDREVGTYSENGMTYIQTDSAVNPGNSGGPLVNMYGQVVGITSSKIVADYYEGMGFAIPISSAEEIINQLLSQGYVEGRTRLGITASAYSSGNYEGIEIISFDEDVSSFDGTTAEIGDVITAVEGEGFTSVSELSNLLLLYSPGDQVTVTVYRPSTGQEFDVVITLLADNGETQD